MEAQVPAHVFLEIAARLGHNVKSQRLALRKIYVEAIRHFDGCVEPQLSLCRDPEELQNQLSEAASAATCFFERLFIDQGQDPKLLVKENEQLKNLLEDHRKKHFVDLCTTNNKDESLVKVKSENKYKAEDSKTVQTSAVLEIAENISRVNLNDAGSPTDALIDTFPDLGITEFEKESRNNCREEEQEISKITTELVQNYVQGTEALTASETPADAVVLEAKHQTCKIEALKMAHQKLRQLKNDQVRTEAMQSIEDAIAKKYQENVAANSDKWLQLEKTLDSEAEDLLKAYKTGMKHLVENLATKNEFQAAEQQLKEKAMEDFEIKLNSRICYQDFLFKMRESMVTKLNTEKEGYWKVFLARLKMDGVYVKLAFQQAEQAYTEQMEIQLYSKPWFEPEDLKTLHEKLSSDAVQLTLEDQEYLSLSPVQKQQLEKALEHLYFKYKERNDLQKPVLEPAIGIDLGTTYSCVGVYRGGKVEIIGNFNGDQKSTVPSYVAFNEDGTIDVGEVAEINAHRNPQHTVFDAKRLIGNKFSETREIDRQLWPFEVVDCFGEPRIEVRDRKFRPEIISSKVLSKMKSLAETYLNRKKIVNAVVTVPAYFGDAQRKATKDAAEIAGLNATILNEPTAAAICYQLQFTGKEEQNVLIFDLGGGTFDVVILTMFRGDQEFKVRAIGGDTHLGGRDFDNNMMKALVSRVKRESNGKIDLAEGIDSNDFRERMKALARLRPLLKACEAQKRILSQTPKTNIIVAGLDTGYDFEQEFTRQEFEQVNMRLFTECIRIVDRTLKEAGLAKKEINDIVLVGGSTRIPKIQEMLSEYFDGKALNKRINPDEAVAYGAAFHAALIYGNQQVSDDQQKRKCQDVTPFPLGVAVADDDGDQVMQVLIEKNSAIPITRVRTGFTTCCDGQTEVDVEIYQGHHHYVRGNTLLGQFKLTGIPAGPAGKEIMECEMTINEEGVLNVEARVVTSGRGQSLKVEAFDGRMTEFEKNLEKNKDPFTWS